MPASRYAQGRVAWGLCQRCGLRFKLRNLVFDGYMPGIRVCTSCYDGRHPQEYPINVTDPEALWKPAPDDAPWDAVVSATVSNGQINLSWTAPDPSGAARYETYTLARAYSPDGTTFTAFTTLGVFPLTYWGDDLDLSDLVENGDPAIDNGGIESQTLAYADTASEVGYYQYNLTAQDINGNGPSTLFTLQVSQITPLRILEDDVSYRLLEDNVTFRSVEY